MSHAESAKDDAHQSTEQAKERQQGPKRGANDKSTETLTYEGRVLGPDRQPFAGAQLYLAQPSGDMTKTPSARATTGADGRFEFTASRADFLTAGTPPQVDVFASLQLVAVGKDYAPDWTMPGKRPAGEINLRLQRNDVIIDGRILDLQGKPIAGAKVHVLRVETTPEDDLTEFLETWKSQPSNYQAITRLTKVLYDPSPAALAGTVTSDAEGRFRLPGAGRQRAVVLSIEGPQIEHATLHVLPRTAAEVKAFSPHVLESMMRRTPLPLPVVYGSNFDHVAMPARTIVGTVRDKETGKPLAGVRINGNAVDPPVETEAEAKTDVQGRYQLRGLPNAQKYPSFRLARLL
jgi:hypothetical protein